MKKVLVSILSLCLIGCAAHISPYRDKKIVEIIVKEYPSSKSWAISDPVKFDKVQSLLKRVLPVEKNWRHSFTTFVPLDHNFTLRDSEGHEYYYELSSKYLSSQKATWPITFEEYLELSNALGI